MSRLPIQDRGLIPVARIPMGTVTELSSGHVARLDSGLMYLHRNPAALIEDWGTNGLKFLPCFNLEREYGQRPRVGDVLVVIVQAFSRNLDRLDQAAA